jgi:hypothetical protein
MKSPFRRSTQVTKPWMWMDFCISPDGDAIYKIHPGTLAVSSTNSFQNLNFLNLLYDGRLIAPDGSAILYIFERDFDTNLAHKSPVASYTGISETNTNTIAVDDLNKIYVITVSNVWAIQ